MAEEYGLEDLKRDLIPIMKRMPAYAKLLTLLAKDPRISKTDKTKLAAGIGYMVSPIDLIPGIIPVLGQLDDMLAVLIVLRNVMSTAPAAIINPYLDEVGLSYETVDADTAVVKRTIKDISVTLAKKTGRGLLRIGRYIGRRVVGGSRFSDRANP